MKRHRPLKIPSLLQFYHAKEEARIRHNLKSLFQINQAPSDTYLRERLDVVDPVLIRKSFKKVFAQLQRGNALEQFSYTTSEVGVVALYYFAVAPTFLSVAAIFVKNAIWGQSGCRKQYLGYSHP